MPTVDAVCASCNKPFRTYRNPKALAKAKHLYCSRACYFDSQAAAQLFVCAECGREFLACITPDRPNPKFCSRVCRNKNVAAIVDFVCQECGKVFKRHQSLKRKYCSKTCAGKHSYVVGRNPTIKPQPCVHCNKMLTTTQMKYRSKFCSYSCSSAHRLGISYEAYIALTNGEFTDLALGPDYRGPNWAAQRNNARHRDKYQCQRCGVSEKDLQRQLDVHHIKPFQEFGVANYKSANALSNLISLCRNCHQYVEHNGLVREQLQLF